MTLCVPHQCHSGSSVDELGLHGFVCMKAPGTPARHHALNDLVAQAVASAGIPVLNKPQGLSHSDGKQLTFSLSYSGRQEATHLGCHRCVPVGRCVHCHSSPRSRLSGRAGSCSEVRQLY